MPWHAMSHQTFVRNSEDGVVVVSNIHKERPDVHTKLTRQTQPATLGIDIREAYITDIPVYFDACQNP